MGFHILFAIFSLSYLGCKLNPFIFIEKNIEVCKKLEDLKVLKRKPDLLNHVKIGQGQLS